MSGALGKAQGGPRGAHLLAVPLKGTGSQITWLMGEGSGDEGAEVGDEVMGHMRNPGEGYRTETGKDWHWGLDESLVLARCGARLGFK